MSSAGDSAKASAAPEVTGVLAATEVWVVTEVLAGERAAPASVVDLVGVQAGLVVRAAVGRAAVGRAATGAEAAPVNLGRGERKNRKPPPAPGGRSALGT